MSVKMVDVAEFANVSPSTVSKVLNNKGYIADNTRKKVLNAVAELGYIHKSNKNNKQQQFKKVCIIFNKRMNNVLSNPLYGEIIHGFEEYLSEFNYQIVVKSISGNPKQDISIINELINDPMLSGILSIGYNPDDHELIMYIRETGIPLVLVDNDKFDYGVDCVVNNDFTGSLEMITKLIDLGHTDIAFISGPLSHPSLQKRYNGYIQALEKAKLPLKKDYIKIIQHDNFYINDGENAISELIHNKKIPTAVFTTNDDLAVGVMKKLFQLGYKVPDDISVAGFDGTEMGKHLIPSLSSVYVNKNEMGLMAAIRLYQLINNIMIEPLKIVLSVKVNINDSVRELK